MQSHTLAESAMMEVLLERYRYNDDASSSLGWMVLASLHSD